MTAPSPAPDEPAGSGKCVHYFWQDQRNETEPCSWILLSTPAKPSRPHREKQGWSWGSMAHSWGQALWSTRTPVRQMSHGNHIGVKLGKIHGRTCSYSPDGITPPWKSEVFYSLCPWKTFGLMLSRDPSGHLGQEMRRLFKDLSLLTPRAFYITLSSSWTTEAGLGQNYGDSEVCPSPCKVTAPHWEPSIQAVTWTPAWLRPTDPSQDLALSI